MVLTVEELKQFKEDYHKQIEELYRKIEVVDSFIAYAEMKVVVEEQVATEEVEPAEEPEQTQF